MYVSRVAERPVIVAWNTLTGTALRALIEAFVNREGSDYGAVPRSLDEKAEDVMRQLRRGEAKIVFDLESESASIVTAKVAAAKTAVAREEN